MPETDKNSLTIRLTESVVFLTPRQHTLDASDDSRSSMLRGLLTLHLVKPMKISSIELELQAKARTVWSEGGPSQRHRRIDVTDEVKLYSASTVFFRADSHPSYRRPASVCPGVYSREEEVEEWDQHSRTNTPHTAELPHVVRRASADSSVLQPNYHSNRFSFSPTPTYISDPPSPPATYNPHEHPAQTLEDLRRALHADLETQPTPSCVQHPGISSLNASSDSSDLPLSLRPHIEEADSENKRQNDSGPSRSNETPRSPWHSPDSATMSPAPNRRNESQKSGGQFSLSAVSNIIIGAVKDHVRSTSRTRTDKVMEGVRAGSSDGPNGEQAQSLSRGRALEKKKENSGTVQEQPSRKDRFLLPKMLKLDGDDKNKDGGDGWKEFKKGTYTYPISFPIPGDSPPSLQCNGGTVTWRLKASVHRPGPFTPKLSAHREVVLVAGPREDDTDGVNNLLIERQWASQLQYLVSISGRAFYIGGTMPIQFVMMPLTKVKIHQISVILQEKIHYYVRLKHLARSDPIKRFCLLDLKYPDKTGLPLLPLQSDDIEAFKNSPFYGACGPDDNPSEMASNLMGPGPWTFYQDLQLPSSCSLLHFTTRNKRSNVVIHHAVKITIRVEWIDGEHASASGKHKIFDITLQIPVHIFSCRCNPVWASLPRYSCLEGGSDDSLNCPCYIKRFNSLQRINSRLSARLMTAGRRESRSSLDSGTTAETSPINPVTMPSLRALHILLDRNTQFERLVSGQESESGEAPPSYDDVPRLGATSSRAQ